MSQPVTRVVGLDPGYRQTAIVVFDGARVVEHRILPNEEMLILLQQTFPVESAVLVIEEMQLFSSSFGVGREVFDSVFWSGRFAQVWAGPWERILRSKVRGHLQASKGGDAAVRASLVDRFGPYKETAIGTKSNKGPLYGIKADEWSALAIAVTWWDLHVAPARNAHPESPNTPNPTESPVGF